MSTVTRQTMIDALAAVIQAAPAKERSILAQAVEDYALTYSNSYRQMTRGNTMVNSLLDCIEENAEARIERDSVGTPIRAAH
jgi:hypothetical protein